MARALTQIGLLNHLGYGNLGDDGSLDAVIQNIRRRWPQAVIRGLPLNAYDTERRYGISSYATRRDSNIPPRLGRASNSGVTLKVKLKAAFGKYRFFFMILRAINTVIIRMPKKCLRQLYFLVRSPFITRSLDLLIIWGGGQLRDSCSGSWTYAFTMFKWILLAKIWHVKCYIINVGAGPLDLPLSRFFVRQVLALADYVSLRDEKSQMLVQELGFMGRTHVRPHSGYSLDIPAHDLCVLKSRGKASVGLAPMEYSDPRLIRTLALFGSWLIKNEYDVALFCSDIGSDPSAVEEVESILRTHTDIASQHSIGSLCRVHQWSTEELLSNMASMDYVVTCRFHGVVYAHMLNKPVLAISYHPKVATLMKDIKLSEYCVDIRTVDPDVLTHTFVSLVGNRDYVKARMTETLACYKKELKGQFDELFPGEVR